MSAAILVPETLWDGDGEGSVSNWFYRDGETVQQGDTVAEVMSEKVTFELTAPATGRLTIAVPLHGTVHKGERIGEVG